jgi:hypothetical protein
VAAVRRAACIALAGVALCVPGTASAQKCIARPGTAALDQYCETLPTDKGDTPARPSDGKLRSSIPASDVDRLERHGKDGQAVLALPTGPKPPSPPSGGSSSGGPALSATPPEKGAPADSDAPPDAPSANPFSATFEALGGVGALGWGIVLTLVLLAAGTAVASLRPASDE